MSESTARAIASIGDIFEQKSDDREEYLNEPLIQYYNEETQELEYKRKSEFTGDEKVSKPKEGYYYEYTDLGGYGDFVKKWGNIEDLAGLGYDQFLEKPEAHIWDAKEANTRFIEGIGTKYNAGQFIGKFDAKIETNHQAVVGDNNGIMVDWEFVIDEKYQNMIDNGTFVNASGEKMGPGILTHTSETSNITDTYDRDIYKELENFDAEFFNSNDASRNQYFTENGDFIGSWVPTIQTKPVDITDEEISRNWYGGYSDDDKDKLSYEDTFRYTVVKDWDEKAYRNEIINMSADDYSNLSYKEQELLTLMVLENEAPWKWQATDINKDGVIDEKDYDTTKIEVNEYTQEAYQQLKTYQTYYPGIDFSNFASAVLDTKNFVGGVSGWDEEKGEWVLNENYQPGIHSTTINTDISIPEVTSESVTEGGQFGKHRNITSIYDKDTMANFTKNLDKWVTKNLEKQGAVASIGDLTEVDQKIYSSVNTIGNAIRAAKGVNMNTESAMNFLKMYTEEDTEVFQQQFQDGIVPEEFILYSVFGYNPKLKLDPTKFTSVDGNPLTSSDLIDGVIDFNQDGQITTEDINHKVDSGGYPNYATLDGAKERYIDYQDNSVYVQNMLRQGNTIKTKPSLW